MSSATMVTKQQGQGAERRAQLWKNKDTVEREGSVDYDESAEVEEESKEKEYEDDDFGESKQQLVIHRHAV